MDDLDLREQFEQWAEPLRAAAVPPDVAFLVERVRRRRVRRARAATSALAVAGLVTAVAVIGLPRHTAGPAATGYGGPGPIPIGPGQPAALGLGPTAMWGATRATRRPRARPTSWCTAPAANRLISSTPAPAVR